MEWFENIKELIPGIKKYPKLSISLSLSIAIVLSIIFYPEKTSFIFTHPFFIFIPALATICFSFFLLDKIEYMKEVCPELKKPQAITMKEIDHVINLLTTDMDILVHPQEADINPREIITLAYSINKYFILMATVCYKTSASRTEIENRLYNSINENDPIIIVMGGCTKTVNDLVTKIASLNLIRNTAISDYQQEARWTLTPLGEKVYKEIELRNFNLKHKK